MPTVRTATAAFAASFAALWSTAAHGQSAQDIYIPEQELRSAITELGTQTGIVVSASADAVSGLTSTEVDGIMTPLQALRQMLSGTGLSLRSVEEESAVVSQNLIDEPFDLGTLTIDSISGSFGAGGVENSFDTESSVTTLDREDIESQPGNQTAEEFLTGLPNINTLGRSNGFVQIRGEDSEGAGNAAFAIIPGALSPTPVTVDGRPISFAELTFGGTSVYDTEFVEVVRGPSTTRGGINGSIGAINIVSASPVFARESEFMVEGGTLEAYQVAGFFNTPLSDDVAVRLTFDSQGRDTYVRFPSTAIVISDADRLRQDAVRLSLLWEPSEIPDLTVRFQLNYADFSGPQTEIVNQPVEELTRTTNPAPAAFSSTAYSFTNSIEYAVSDRLIVSNRFTYSENDTERRSGSGTFSLDEDGSDLTNETRVDFSSADNRFSGLAGIYYRRQENNVDWDYFGPTLIDGDRDSLGIYTDVSYDVTDQFEVFGGLRYQYETQDRAGVIAQTGNPTSLDFSRTDDAFLPRLGFAYKPTETTRVGFVAARGFAPGGFSFAFPDGAFNDGVTPLLLPEFEDETRWTYEIFARARMLNDRLDLSANLFYNDIDDIQIVSLIENPAAPGSQIGVITNGDRAVTYGLELSADYQVTSDLRLFGSLGLLDSEFKSFSSSPEVVGNELQEAPDTTLSIGLDYNFTRNLNVRADMNYVSGYFSNFANDPQLKVPDRTIVNLNATYTPRDNVELYAFVNNLFDERSPTFLFGSGAFESGGVTTPRQVGFGARMRF